MHIHVNNTTRTQTVLVLVEMLWHPHCSQKSEKVCHASRQPEKVCRAWQQLLNQLQCAAQQMAFHMFSNPRAKGGQSFPGLPSPWWTTGYKVVIAHGLGLLPKYNYLASASPRPHNIFWQKSSPWAMATTYTISGKVLLERSGQTWSSLLQHLWRYSGCTVVTVVLVQQLAHCVIAMPYVDVSGRSSTLFTTWLLPKLHWGRGRQPAIHISYDNSSPHVH